MQTPEPAPPIATLPYFPGDKYLDDNGKETQAGEAPEWDYHTLTGWKFDSAAGGEEVTLTTPIKENVTVTAVWTEAPAKPYHTITFNRNAGTGVYEKRIAVPTKTYYETTATETGTDITEWTQGEETYYVTANGNAENIKEGGLKFYKDYKIQVKDYSEKDIALNLSGNLIPEFTREHYTRDGWTDIKGLPITINDNSTFDDGDEELYQKWEPKRFTINFNANGKTLSSDDLPPSIADVNEADSAEGGVKKATGKVLPKITAEITDTNNDTEIKYIFKNWMDVAEGGNIISDNTPIYPKDGGDSLTLYAQWVIDGMPPVVFNYTGSVQTWKVPADGIYKIEVWGAGGIGLDKGGQGGYISGNISLDKGKELYIYCGGQGGKADNHVAISGGWNGGGANGGERPGNSGGAGHGATDVRILKADPKKDPSDDIASLGSRIIVAGGGGGAGWSASKDGNKAYGTAGNGGYGIAAGGNGTSAYDNGFPSYGGTIEGGGAKSGNGNDGSLGKGGDGSKSTVKDNRGGGGGGGGYYGGAGGAVSDYANATSEGSSASPGGGGSSWAKIIDDDGELGFISDSISPGSGTYYGHGKAKISFLGTAAD
ncbi:MAG: InlB B-repeat-containing protein [Spirochaetaceae bacterium]|nr:InlB B-repeat-containing protein [Spirochaetaceae bacterium]